MYVPLLCGTYHALALPCPFAPGRPLPQVTLSTNDPQSAIADIQRRGALQDPRCRPLLGLLDQLGLPRWVHRVPGTVAQYCCLVLHLYCLGLLDQLGLPRWVIASSSLVSLALFLPWHCMD